MIVMLQKLSKWNFFVILFFLSQNWVYSQINNCNQSTYLKTDKKRIPKEVCIPNDYIIYYIYGLNDIDFNHDGLIDFVFYAKKKTQSIGDTALVYFYKRVSDSSFVLFKRFDNIIPIYFDPSDENQKFDNKKLEDIFNCYPIPNPMNHLEIKNDSIEIIINMDGRRQESLVYLYRYSEKNSDWELINKTHWFMREKTEMNISPNTLLSNFSYCE